MKDICFFIEVTGESIGLWIMVNVTEYDNGFCHEGKVIRKYTGWIKALDDSGMPEIWYWPRGC